MTSPHLPKPSLEIHPLTLQDFTTLSTPTTQSFGLIGMPTPLSIPLPSTPFSLSALHTFHFTHQRNRFLHDPTVHYMKCISASTGEILSIARWHFYPRGYSYELEAHWELHPLPNVNPNDDDNMSHKTPENFDVSLHNHILTTRDIDRARWIPEREPCWILMHLVTHPEHRGKGAAGLLMKWGVERCEREGMKGYLEAGVQGRPVYEKVGFREVVVGEEGGMVVDLGGFGGGEGGVPEEIVMCRMVYEPSGGEV